MNKNKDVLNKKVCVIIDRPLGSAHPKYNNTIYPVNYGYIRGIIAGDGECQDCYVLGENKPIKRFNGVVVAIIHRKNDVEDKWIVVKDGDKVTNEQIIEQTAFQEQYFDIGIIR